MLTKTFFITTAVGAAIFAAVDYYVTNYLQKPEQVFGNGTGKQATPTSGTIYQGRLASGSLSLDPQIGVYQSPGNQQSNASNGNIYVKKFNPTGNHNSMVGYEQSYAIQTSTKNPFANGTNNSYANAVNNAAVDPTNQATALVTT